MGTDSEASVDYAPIAARVARDIAAQKAEKGILCCGRGSVFQLRPIKQKGIRAAVCTDPFCAEMTRRHNDANILCMGGRDFGAHSGFIGKDLLETPFEARASCTSRRADRGD